MRARELRLVPGCGYLPFDEVLAHPRVRIFRLLVAAGWTYSSGIKHAMGVVDDDSRNLISTHLSRMQRRGWLAVRGGRRGSHGGEYAITDAGRAELARCLALSAIAEPSEDDCVTCALRRAICGGQECGECLEERWTWQPEERAEHVRRLARLAAA